MASLKIQVQNEKLLFAKSITDKDGFIQITIPPDAYELESSNNETKSIIIEEHHSTDVNNPFTIKPSFSTLNSIKESPRPEPLLGLTLDDCIRDILAFYPETIYEKYNLSPNLVDTLSFDNSSIDTNRAQGRIFKGKLSGKNDKFTMDDDPGCNYI